MSKQRIFLGLLAQRNFRLFWTGETTSQLGNAMARVAMPLLAVDVLHASNFLVASITTAAYVPWLIIGLPIGAWIDRSRPRLLMIAADLLSLVLYSSVPIAYWLGALTISQVLAVALLTGVCSVVFLTGYQVFLPSLLKSDELIEGNAKIQAGGSATRIGGPGLGGLMSQLIGPAATLLFNAASFLVSAVCLFKIGRMTSQGRPPRQTSTIRKDILEGIRFVVQDPYLRPVAVFAALFNLGLSGYLALIVVFLVRSVGLTSGTVGVIMALGATGGLFGAFLARRLTTRYGTARTLIMNVACTTPFILLIPFTAPGIRLACCVVGVMMLEGGLIISTVILSSFRQSYSPREMLGRVATTMQILTYGTPVLGSLLAGSLASWFGPRVALWVLLGTNVLAGAVLLTPKFIGVRDLPTRKSMTYARESAATDSSD
jgi:MFS family permease